MSVNQVAPFRRAPSASCKAPKRPGRKPGHPGNWRGSPPSAASDEHIEVVLVACPECGEALPIEEQRAVEQTILELEFRLSQTSPPPLSVMG